MDRVKLVSGSSVYSFSASESLFLSPLAAFSFFSRFFLSFFSRFDSFRLSGVPDSVCEKPGNYIWKRGRKGAERHNGDINISGNGQAVTLHNRGCGTSVVGAVWPPVLARDQSNYNRRTNTGHFDVARALDRLVESISWSLTYVFSSIRRSKKRPSRSSLFQFSCTSSGISSSASLRSSVISEK